LRELADDKERVRDKQLLGAALDKENALQQLEENERLARRREI